MRSENTGHRGSLGNYPASKHALIIEHFPVIAMSIEDDLSDLGFSSSIAASVAQAVSLAEERCPDLIIADARLAEGSGIDVVRRICRGRPIAVIFMSGDLERLDGCDVGDAGFLSKPFTSTTLRSIVEMAGPLTAD